MRTLGLAAILLIATASFGSARGAETLVLDETAYCRSYIEFGMDQIDPAALRKEGEAVLNQDRRRNFASLKRKVRTYHRALGMKWDEAKWMDHAIIAFGGLQYSSRDGIDPFAYTEPPPENWMALEFDDTGWVNQRLPIMMARRGAAGRGATHGHRSGSFRFHFNVPDPAKISELRLAMTYRGGVRAFINGTEIARQHLPKGKLAPNTPGQSYPLEAYVVFKKDGKIDICTDKHRRGRLRFMPEIIGPFDKAVKYAPRRVKLKEDLRLNTPRRGVPLNRETWEKYLKLRDRHIGPVKIPGKLLRKGDNVLAIEIRTSLLHPCGAAWETMAIRPNEAFDHGHLLNLTLQDPSGTIPAIDKRPAGIQVWAEDMHRRVIDRDYHDNPSPGTIRFSGANNGTFSAQVVIGSDKALTGLKCQVSRLTSAEDPARNIPGSAFRILSMPPHRVSEMVFLGCGRGGAEDTRNPLRPGEVGVAVARHGLNGKASTPGARLKSAAELNYFDHISATPPATVAANTSQPIWLSLSVDDTVKPGTYRGTVTVEADGMKAVSVPVEAEISNWRIPDPQDSQVYVALEQSPYGIAKQYKIRLWSDKHFELIEASVREMGRIGNDFVFVPIVQNTEFGNRDDCIITWTRKQDGSYAFDLKHLDRYLSIVTKYWGRPECICFVVIQGAKGNPAFVKLHDEKTGKTETLNLNSDSPHYTAAWTAFGLAVYDYMKSKRLENSMYWGFAWDDESDPGLPILLSQVTPDIHWASGGHGHSSGGGKHYYKIRSFIYKLGTIAAHSRMGWKRPNVLLVNPRGGGNVTCVQGTYNPYAYRIAIDRALISGAHGMARLGTDYWQNIFLDGLKSGGFLRPGMPVSAMFYPGQNGAETSQRFESMREGVQETDARIFVEQAIDRGYIKGDLAKRAKEVLFQHNRQTLFLPVGGGVKHFEYYTGWQGRSKRLFDIAGEVAKTVPFDINPSKLDVYVPARGEKRTTLKLRNWTTSPREWKISCDKPWLVPEKPGGKLLGHEELTVTINAKQLEPGKPVEAAITITDIASDRTFQIALTGNVSKVFEYIPPDTKILYRYWPDRGSVVLNVPAQGQKSAPITLLNRAGAPLKWTSRVVAKNTGKPVPWVKVEPAQGTIAARTPLILTVTAAPPDKDGARHELVLKVSEADGTAGAEASFVVYAMPPYKAPALPQGEAVVIKREIGKALQPWLGDRGTPWGATPAKKYEGCTSKWERMHQAVNLVRGEHFPFMVRAGVPHEVKFKIEGAGYKALSVKVGLPDTYAMHRYRRPHDYPKWLRMNMEIFVDGKLRTQSGMMGTDDKARLLVVDGLENAKELKLRARMNKFPGIGVHTVWGSPTLYK